MREILFRAKRKDNGEWIEGCYIHCAVSGRDFIFPKGNEVNESQLISEEGCLKMFCFEVIPETVCQYIGLTDKNDCKIWENDIVKLPREDELFVIRWDTDAAEFVIESNTWSCDFDNYWGNELEVISNIFDNADLLEEQT